MTVPALTPRAAREQRTFRTLMNAMARPGTVAQVHPHPALAGRFAPALSLLEAVLDHEVTFAVLPEQAAVIDAVLRLTGSRPAPADQADYLLALGDGIARALQAAGTGTPEYPDRGATVFVAVEAVSDTTGSGIDLRLSGPGIRDARTVWVDGLLAEHMTLFQEANADLPQGIDLVLVTPDGRFTCLPRYTRWL